MINNLEAYQKLGQQNVDKALKIFGEWNKGWRTISVEMTDFTKGSFEDGAATVEKLLGAKSLKIVIPAVVSLAIAASLVGQVTAAPLRNKKHAHRQHTMTKPPRPLQGGGDYYEHLLDKVPFGSQRWWDIYQQQHGRG